MSTKPKHTLSTCINHHHQQQLKCLLESNPSKSTVDEIDTRKRRKSLLIVVDIHEPREQNNDNKKKRNPYSSSSSHSFNERLIILSTWVYIRLVIFTSLLIGQFMVRNMLVWVDKISLGMQCIELGCTLNPQQFSFCSANIMCNDFGGLFPLTTLLPHPYPCPFIELSCHKDLLSIRLSSAE